MLNKLNPFFRYGSKFLLSPRKYDVVAPDCRLLYVNCGQATLVIKGTKQLLGQGSVFYCPKGTVYYLENSKEETVVTVLNFDLTEQNCFDTTPRTPVMYSATSVLKFDDFFKEVEASRCFLSDYKVINNADMFLDYFESILKTFQSEEPYNRELCGCTVKTMLLKLNYEPQSKKENVPELLKKIFFYINNNYTKPIENNAIAEFVGYHPNYIGRIFKEHLQISIHQYILDLRVAEAKRLITQTNLSFQEIAERSGFKDYPYFSAYFKQKTGVSPAKYRKQNIGLI